MKKSLKLSSVNSPVVASMKATNTTCTTGITKKASRKIEISSITAVCPGCSLNAEIAPILASTFQADVMQCITGKMPPVCRKLSLKFGVQVKLLIAPPAAARICLSFYFTNLSACSAFALASA
ncbi:MAG: hypothetical protein PVF56_20690 [Desulfobacterales bacterium]